MAYHLGIDPYSWTGLGVDIAFSFAAALLVGSVLLFFRGRK